MKIAPFTHRLLPIVCLLCLLLPLNSSTLQAQTGNLPASQFVFPRFISSDGVGTGIAVFNPSARDATLDLTAVAVNGAALGRTTITVPALGRIAVTAAELFPTKLPLDASLTISSSTPNLAACYQTYDTGLSFIDGTDAPESAFDLLFPVVPSSSEGSVGFDFLNPNARATSAELKLWSFEGVLLGKATVQVPAGGIYSNLVTDIFPPGTDFSRASHMTSSSKALNILSPPQTIYGTSLFAGFSSSAPVGAYLDIAALNAVPVTQVSNAGVIPYFRTSGRHASTLSLASIEPAGTEVTITAVSDEGAAFGTQKVTLSPNGGFRQSLRTLFPALDSRDLQGWLLIQSSGRVYGALVYGRSDAAALSAIPMQNRQNMAFVFPQAVQNSGSFTEITLTNASTSGGYADVYVVQPDGTTIGSSRITLAPISKTTRTLDQLAPELTDLAGGYVYARATVPLFATASIWSTSGSTLSNFAPQSESTDFSPAPQRVFSISGRVTLNDTPAPGFRIVLSGPLGAIATSAADGSYAFRNLPPGKYSMAIDQFGFRFDPTTVNLEITSSSRRQDFVGITPDGIVVVPAAIPVKSPDTGVIIYGRDFNAGSQAYVGPVRLATTFVDAIHVQAKIPAYMLATPAKFEIFVVTNDPGPDRWATQNFPVIAYQDRPLLSSVTSSTEIVENSPAATLTLRGTGFIRDAVVKINGLSDNIQINVVDDTQILAVVPASYFTHGGIYPVTVQNPYPANIESNIQLLTVYYPAPEVTGLVPGAVPAKLERNASPLSLDVLGYGFRRGALVLFNGQPIPTTYCDWDDYCLGVHLFAKVPVDYLRQSGFAQITVQNPIPSLGPSGTTILRIDGLQPTITSVLPGYATLMALPFQFTIPVVVNGTNFGPQTVVRIYQTGTEPPSFSSSKSTILSSTQLVVSLRVDWGTSIGEWKVEVANPPPGGGQSDAFTFSISPASFVANPFLISLDPQEISAGAPSFTLTINGTNFKTGSQIYFYNAPLVTTVVSDTVVQAVVPSSLVQTAGAVPVSVMNPDSGGSSNRLFLTIR